MEPRHDQDVAFAECLQHAIELRPFALLAGRLLLEDLFGARGLQLLDLGFERLAGCETTTLQDFRRDFV